MKAVAGVLATIVAILVVVAISIGVYQLHWFVEKKNVQNQYEVNTGTQQYQSSLIERERDLASGYQASDNAGQKTFIAGQFCALIKDTHPLPEDIQSDAVLMNCQ
jgi:uncharacterized protein HemX